MHPAVTAACMERLHKLSREMKESVINFTMPANSSNMKYQGQMLSLVDCYMKSPVTLTNVSNI